MQIADVIPLVFGKRDLAFFRVVWLEYARDKTFYEKVLDIDDEEISAKVFSNRVMVTELTYNERKGYLCHKSSIEEV